MSRWEYHLSSLVLRVLGLAFSLLPVRRRQVVLATARLPHLEGNLLFIDEAIARLRPGTRVVRLLEPYGYGFGGKVRYLLRLVRGMFYLRTSGLVVVDNAWLPVHVAPHGERTTVVQVWHAAGALKRFGADTVGGLTEPEATFLHRHYDWVVCGGEGSRKPWSLALRTPLDRVLPIGVPRTDLFFDEAALTAARERVLAANPTLRGRRIVLWAPTFRGRGRHRTGTDTFDAAWLRDRLPADTALVRKSHPNLDPSGLPDAGFDVIADPLSDMNDWLAAADVLVTDYSSSIHEWALLRRPLILLVDDLEAYERDPGTYLDYRHGMIGVQVRDTAGIAAALDAGDRDPSAWGLDAYEAFVARNLGACDGHASDRFVERFVPRR